jgi:hypothetical protein
MLNFHNPCDVDFIKKVPSVFESMAKNFTSLQDILNELMMNRRTDAIVTRVWSTCPSLLRIISYKGKDEDNHFYNIDHSNLMPLNGVLKYVQNSREIILNVTVDSQERVKASFEELYATLLIEGQEFTTHYVSMTEEFLYEDKDFIKRKLNEVSSRCIKSASSPTKIIVLVALDCKETKQEISNQTDKPALLEQSNSRGSEISSSTYSPCVLKKLLKRLLIYDGIDTVVTLTNPDEPNMALSLFEELKDEKVRRLNKSMRHRRKR